MNKHKAVTRTLDSGDPHNIQVALLVAAREEERKKIARELHDSVGQEMAALALEINSVLDSCRKLGVRKELREVCETLHHSYTRISYLTTCEVGSPTSFTQPYWSKRAWLLPSRVFVPKPGP